MMAMFGCCVHNQPRGEPCGLCPDGKAVIANVSENLALDPTGALAAHRKLAEKATPGPWTAENFSGQCKLDHEHGRGDCDYRIVKYNEPGTEVWRGPIEEGAPSFKTNDRMIAGQFDYEAGGIVKVTDAAFIAANSPEKIAALIDVAEKAEKMTYRGAAGDEHELHLALDRLKAAYKEKDDIHE